MVKKKAGPKASSSAPAEKTATTATTTAAASPARKPPATATTSTRASRSGAIPPELPKALPPATTGASASTGRATRGSSKESKEQKEEEPTATTTTTTTAGKKTAAPAPATAASAAPASKKAKVAEKKGGKKAAETTEAPPAAAAPAPSLIYPVMGSPGIPQGGTTATSAATAAAVAAAGPGGGPQSGIAFTDQDILLPTTNEQIAARPANREYIQLLQANCAAFHSLPSNEQAWMLNNVCHFLTHVRKHRMLHYHPYYGWRVLTEPLPFIVAEISLDTFKRAAFRFHPLWLLGDHDPSGYHRGTPFVHRKVTGAWRRASVEDVRMILQGEGLKNLLLLPTGMDLGDVDDADLGGSTVASEAKEEVSEAV